MKNRQVEETNPQFLKENTTPYRMGAAYIGYQNYSIGVNSEGVRNQIQNRIIHKTFNYKYFKVIGDPKSYQPFYQHSNQNPYTLW